MTTVPSPAASRPPELRVVGADEVLRTVEADRAACLEVVAAAYRLHAAGQSVNPPSTFLRFPGRPGDRIITLPAQLGGAFDVAGVKWISSVPANRAAGLARASAVLILNDVTTGFAYACMEGSVVSATRTAGSAALAAEHLTGGRSARRLGIVGAGLIARNVVAFLRDLGWEIGAVSVHDLVPAAADAFAADLEAAGPGPVSVETHVRDVVEASDLVVFATVATEPHVEEPSWFAHDPVVLHLSLRDLGPKVIAASQNIVDDVDHALREGTSLQRTEDALGHRDFVAGTIDDVLDGRLKRRPGRPAIFSPFGLGVLDLAVGAWVYDRLTENETEPRTVCPRFHPAPPQHVSAPRGPAARPEAP